MRTLLSLLLTCITASATSPIITASGQQVSSLFDGLVPSRVTRDGLVLKLPQGLPDLNSIGKAIGVAPKGASCPSGGPCASPYSMGVSAGPGACDDPDPECTPDLFNPADSEDPNSGIMELYYCSTCCVSWPTCNLGGGGGGGGGCATASCDCGKESCESNPDQDCCWLLGFHPLKDKIPLPK
jgi:hypothetical protein